MRRILVVGMGAGNPEHITMQAVGALNSADVLFITDKGGEKSSLADVRRTIVSRYVTGQPREVVVTPPVRDTSILDYHARVEEWHARLAATYAALFAEELEEDQTGAMLVWGDPGLYDSTIRILDRILAGNLLPLTYDVIPGITSIQALTAAHRIAFNQIGAPVEVTTGRRLAELGLSGDAVVMLDGEQAFAALPDETEIFWGAYLGTPDEILISGRLGTVRERIVQTRAQARQAHGWIMDIYLLRP